MSKEVKYYDFVEILKKLNLYHKFNNKDEYLPQVFNHKIEEFDFSWGEIIIPKKGIRETVTNALSISKKTEILLDELKFIWIIPYKLDKVSPFTNGEISTYGNIYQNISLTFRYDKTWKCGEITNTIEECCFFILEYAKDIGDFYVITGKDNVQDFINQVIIPNQYATRCGWASDVINAWSKPNPEDDSLTKIDSENEEANKSYQLHFSDGKIYDPICINRIHNGIIYNPNFVNNNDESGKTNTVKEPDVDADILPDAIMIPKVSDGFFDEFRALSPESKREVLENLKNIIENEADVINPIIDVSAEIHAANESVKKELIKEKDEEIRKPVLDGISKRWELYFDTNSSRLSNSCPNHVPKDDKE